jgi:hypothetical protein
MKATIVVGAFLAAGLIALPLFAFAKQVGPIPGVPIGLEEEPGGVVIAQTRTNSAGVAVFRNVKPGKYQLIISAIFDRWGGGPCPCAADVAINVPGQAKVVRTISKAKALSKNREDLNFSIRFIVAGNRAQTVTLDVGDSFRHR